MRMSHKIVTKDFRSWMVSGIIVFSLLAAVLVSLSFVDFDRFHSFTKEVMQIEKRIHQKQAQLETAALAALETSKEEWMPSGKLGEDQILYKYYQDSLCSWVNTLPITNDAIYVEELLSQKIKQYITGEAFLKYPLVYVDQNYRYMNLGSAWYVVKAYYKDPYTVITALLIQTDDPVSNLDVKSVVNPALGVGKHLTIAPLNIDGADPVFGIDGNSVLFNVLNDVQIYNAQSALIFRWLSILCAISAIFCFLRGFPTGVNLGVVLTLFVALRILCYLLEQQMSGGSSPLFSSALYADPYFSGSLADLLLNHLFVFLSVLAIMTVRHSFARFFLAMRDGPRRTRRHVAWSLGFAVLPVLLMVYIHLSFRSVIHNSGVVMEIFKINELSIYSALVYAFFGLLFAALYLLICLGWPVWIKKGSRTTLLSQKVLAMYVVAVSLYSLSIVSVYGAHKEGARNRVWIQKVAIERDPDVELFLRDRDIYIATDVMLRYMLETGQPTELIQDRLVDYFLPLLKNRYDIKVTTCAPGDNLLVDGTPPPVNCYNFFHQAISNCGTQLYEDAHFYYLDNANGRTSYIGVFPFRFLAGYKDLYIEIDSRPVKEQIGYPALLRDHVGQNSYQIPPNYSFAKYVRGNLSAFSGNYTYSTQYTSKGAVGSFTTGKERGYRHYVYIYDNQTIIILSHPVRTFFLYLVSFSYITLFYFLIIMLVVHKPMNLWARSNPKRSFKRKIMLLVVVSMVISLVAMAIGSISFGIRMYNDHSAKEMDEKMQTAQSTLEFYFREIDDLHEITGTGAERLAAQLNQLSKNVHIDINIYNLSGVLVHTSQEEVFEKHLMGTRMNGMAFEAMNRLKRLKYFHQEHIGSLRFYSVYAPLYNDRGKLIAYLNLPYFARLTTITDDISSVVATVLNIYILLLVAALLAGMAISNQLSRPLVEVGNKMRRLDLTKQLEHINYHGDDELGGLIRAYNEMVDDVAAASQRMAQTEREQAWREMARQIAHEIKNPLTPMRLSLQHLMRLKKENVPDWPDRFDGLAQTLIEQIDILSDAASELSSFSRFYTEETAPVELNQLIREQCMLFTTGEAIKLFFDSEVDPAVVMGRKQQLSRVLVNLISNAKQALEGRPNRQIRLRLEQIGAQYALHIEDNGPGVPEKLRNRLFTPNFTTKSGGTGLGLAICRSIIEQTQGDISYGTSEWGGACFTIRLPVYEG